MKFFKGSKRGQLVVSNLFYILFFIILMGVLYQPLLMDMVVTPHENDTGPASLIIKLYPVFYWLGGLFLIFITFMPVRNQGG